MMMGPGQRQMMVLSQNTKRESGRKVQLSNISAAKNVADVIRTSLGPRAMLKMLMDPMGGIVMTNDGNAILREITVQHPAAKSLIEIARSQDEEVGDGTTSVVILTGEVMKAAQQFLEQQMHPTVIISAYRQALEDMIVMMKDISFPVDINKKEEMMKILKSSIGTKFLSKWSELACEIAYEATCTVTVELHGRREIDLKKYAKVEKIPGGSIEDSRVLKGVMFEKDVCHPRMRRRIEKPKILLLDCALEFKKGESQTNLEIMKEEDFSKILQKEEEYVSSLCEDIIRFKPDLVITEKGVSDLAQHFLVKAGISVIRRLRKTDNNRVARAIGATIVSRVDEIRESDMGTGAGLFEVKKMGDDYFTFIVDCENPKACTIVLRGASKDVLHEVERNLNDCMQVARNVMVDARLLPGGGATEMALSCALTTKSKSLTGVEQWPYRALARALEVIPQTLILNCGGNTMKIITALRAKHASNEGGTWGINGEAGTVEDMAKLGVWDAYSVKEQTFKTAIETSILLLRIDDIVSGSKKISEANAPGKEQVTAEAAPEQ